MGSFGRFTFGVVLIVLICFASFLYMTGRLPGGFGRTTAAPAPNSSMAPLPSAPSTPAVTPNQAATPNPATPAPLDTPPDIGGLNFPEVAVPGADLSTPASPSSFASAPNPVAGDYVGEITSHRLQMPLDNIQARQLSDTFNEARTGSKHEAIDIMARSRNPHSRD